MASFVDVKQVAVKDVRSGREIPAEVQVERLNDTIFCNLIAKRSGKIFGSMTFQLGRKDATLTTIKNFYEGRVAHVGKELVQYAKEQAAEKGLRGVSTFATGNSHGFFYSQGFLPINEEARGKVSEAMAQVAETGKRANTVHVGGTFMRDYIEIREDQRTPKARNF